MFRWLKRRPQAVAIQEQQKDACPDGYTTPEPAGVLLGTELRQKLIEMIWQRTSMSKAHFEDLYLTPIRRYAELVQHLPASENHHHAYPGGMLDHGLEIIAYALKLRQSHLLPPGAPPEDQAAQAEAWTAGLTYAALLHDIGKIAVDQQIELLSGKRWHPWHGPINEPYRMRFVRGRDYHQHPAAGALLVHQVLPTSAMDWLSGFQMLFGQLSFVLTGHYDQAGVLGELVIKADQASVAKAVGGNPTKAMAAPKDSLQSKLIMGLRQLVKEKLRLNQPGAAGWLTEEALWLVSKPISDQLRALLLSQGIEGIPTRNSRLFDELQSHGIIQQTPEQKAIWDCTVTDKSGWTQGLTMLKVAPAMIWGAGDTRPESFTGTVVIGPMEATTEPAAAAQAPAKEPSVGKNNSTHKSVPPPTMEMDFDIPFDEDHDDEAASIYMSTLPEVPVHAELDELDLLMGQNTKAATANSNEASSTPNDQAGITGAGRESSSAPHSLKPEAPWAPLEGEVLGKRFIEWLADGLKARRIVINDAKAKVHTIAGTAFIVTPGIFQRFVMEHPSRIKLDNDLKESESWKEVQKQFQKLRLHKKTSSGLNIWKCQVTGQQKNKSRLQGYLLNDPSTLFESIPADNPFLSIEQGE